MNQKKYHIITFGCQMNERDSETMAGILEEMSYVETESPEDADVVLINTCSIRENADNRFYGAVGQLKNLKKTNKNLRVGVTGCMMQQHRHLEKIFSSYPFVDFIFGTQTIDSLKDLLTKSLEIKHKKPIISLTDDMKEIKEGLPVSRRYPFKAYINATLGCDNFCTYCIVPYVRGREKSRKFDCIISEAESAIKNGVVEITLLGQNVNSYYDEGKDFADLIKAIDKLDGIKRIRFMTSHPKDIKDKLINCFNETNSLCPHIHLPVQSGSNKILSLMNRKYTREDYLKTVNKLDKKISITTDIIVGFPGETEKDFKDTLDLIKEVRFASAFTFLYSEREGTKAVSFSDKVDDGVKKERFSRLVETLNNISVEENKKEIGKTKEILVEGKSKTNRDFYAGRTPEHRLVNFFYDKDDIIGKICDVKITEANSFSFIGEL